MRRLVLSEGRRDVRFVELFYRDATRGVQFDTFYGEEVAHSRLKNQESAAVRNFLERRNPYDVLAKSENGKPDLKRVFTKLIHSLARRDLTVTMLIDLDGGPLDALLRDLDTRVEDNYDGRTLGIREVDTSMRSTEQIGVVAELYSKSDDTRQGKFEIIAFRDSLEDSAGIDESDDESAEESTLREFLADERATAPMRELLL